MQDAIKFSRKFTNRAGNKGINIPPELVTYLGLEEGDNLTITADKGKHGKFLSIWKEEKENVCDSVSTKQ